MDGVILLYYKYVEIKDPQQIQKWLRTLCSQLQLTGRIIIAHEGINGTVGGTQKQTDAFKKEFLAHQLFQDTDMKESPGCADDFPRLSIKIRPEIVALGIDAQKLTTKHTAEHLSPDQTHKLINENKNLVIIDTRNDYESRIGTVRGAVLANTKSFREFPEYIDQHADQLKDKEVLMFCTGGVRCERASAYLAEKNVAKKIYQMDGGICRYVEKYPDGHFRGKNYVFDERIAVRVNDDILAQCDVCHTPADTYTDCVNMLCNKHFIACSLCREELGYTCSSGCREQISAGIAREREDRVGVIRE